MQNDALSDVLRVLRMSGALFIRLRLQAPYSLDALDRDTIHKAFASTSDHVMPFHLVTNGPIWFNVQEEGAVELQTGDVIVLPGGSRHALSHAPSPTSQPVSAYEHLIEGSPPLLHWDGSGPEARVLCGFFKCQGRLFNPLIESLPGVVVIRAEDDEPWLVSTLQRTYDETLASRRGGAALIERLATLLFMEVVQRYLEDGTARGWLAGLNDAVVGRVLELMHARPSHPWTVDTLARRAGSSRSIVAERFADTVGTTPIRYLTSWRMELAAAQLLESNDSLSDVAADVGYESETAFSKAFKRHVGMPPATWRRRERIRAAG